MAAILLERWDSMRSSGTDLTTADAEFRRFLTVDALRELEAMGTPLAVDDHFEVFVHLVHRCFALDRRRDAMALTDWLVAHFSGHGEVGPDAVEFAAMAYGELHRDPGLRVRSEQSMTGLVGIAERGRGVRFEFAALFTLVQLAQLLATVLREGVDPRERSDGMRQGVKACDRVIRRWDPHFPLVERLRILVSTALLVKAKFLLADSDTTAVRSAYSKVVGLFDKTGDLEDPAAAEVLLFRARHGLDILDSVRFPEPAFKTEYLEETRAANRRRAGGELRRRLLAALPRSIFKDRTRELTRLARRLHERTGTQIRAHALMGAPIVLLLRNFDLFEWSTTDASPVVGESDVAHAQVIRAVAGQGLISSLCSRAFVTHVASTSAAMLELDANSGMLGAPKLRYPLYLPDDSWQEQVRKLIELCEHIVVWADKKTPGLTGELDLIRSLGREADTTVLLEEPADGSNYIALYGEPPPEIPVLAPEDPSLRGFPNVFMARNTGSADNDADSFLDSVLYPVGEVLALDDHSRVVRMRNRLDEMRRR
ncbi:hypothetical protein ACFTE1_10925 [Salininema proteolyticum]|uniref:hypothetical protein n=1 Tax=Salininema proteolyticum TaxID=1607685 RepID=UPI003625502F